MCVCVFVCVFLAKLKENVAKLPLRLQLTAKLRVEPMTRSFCSCCYACCVVVACLPKQAAANGTLQQQQQQLCLLFAFAIVVCVHLIMIFRCWPQNVGNTFFQLATYALAKHSGHAQWQQLYKKEVLLRYLCKYSTVDLHSGTKRTKKINSELLIHSVNHSVTRKQCHQFHVCPTVLGQLGNGSSGIMPQIKCGKCNNSFPVQLLQFPRN